MEKTNISEIEKELRRIKKLFKEMPENWKKVNEITQSQKNEIATYVYNTYIADPNQTLENALNGNFPSSGD